MHPIQFVLLLSRIHGSLTIPTIGLSGSSFYCTEGFQKYRTYYLHLTSLAYRLQVPGIRILYK